MTQAQQGHAYEFRGRKVLALDVSDRLPTVAYAPPDALWISEPFHVNAEDLKPLPMAYFHGQVPA